MRNFKDFPWRSTKNKYHALVSEIMLQRTRAEQVAPVYNNFVTLYDTPADFLKRNTENIFKNLGLPQRNEEFSKLNKLLVENKIPSSQKELLKLPGVGDYISAAYLSLHLNKRAVIIDSNVIRVYGRFFGLETDPEIRRKKEFREFSDKITPARKHRQFNYGLIDFSKDICAIKPKCLECPIKFKCHYNNEMRLS
jgi:A/G-specific adenine glycosylase